MQKVTILGDGGWGTTLAILLAHKGFQVCLWGAFEENINRIHKRGVNDKFLPGIRVPSSIMRPFSNTSILSEF